MEIYELIESVSEKARRFVMHEMEQFRAEQLGLDGRCGFIFANESCIAVDKRSDRYLQYYGGFEYVDKEYRTELGDYVFYMVDDSRVAGHLSRMFEGVDTDEE